MRMFLSYEPVGDRVREEGRDKYQDDAAAPKKAHGIGKCGANRQFHVASTSCKSEHGLKPRALI